MICENIKLIIEEIESVAESYRVSVPKLIAVSKTVEVERIYEAYKCGVRFFGENKAQEIIKKAPLLPNDIEWHFIGHLQRNKVKQILPYVSYIHSLDSIRLADIIEKEASKLGKRVKVLIEVNTSGEESKYGISKNEAEAFLRELRNFRMLEPVGFMTMAPFTDDEGAINSSFSDLRKIFLKCREIFKEFNLSELSMGMSGDYKIAVRNGSTMVRIGGAIFGKRRY